MQSTQHIEAEHTDAAHRAGVYHDIETRVLREDLERLMSLINRRMSGDEHAAAVTSANRVIEAIRNGSYNQGVADGLATVVNDECGESRDA